MCDPTLQVTLRSSVMGFPLRAILGFNLFFNLLVPATWFRSDCFSSKEDRAFRKKSRDSRGYDMK